MDTIFNDVLAHPDWEDIRNWKEFDRRLKRDYPDFYKFILDNYSDRTNKLSEMLYMFYNNLENKPTCAICGGPVKYINIKNGYRRCCSAKCSCHDPERIRKACQTKIERYGSAGYNNRDKAVKTCLEKYGVDNPFASKEVKNKLKNIFQEKYGVDYPSQAKEVQEVRKQNALRKYGTDHHMHDPEIKKRALEGLRHTFLERDETLLGYKDDESYIRKCPHPDCNKCSEKFYEIPMSNYHARKYFGLELCTRLLPVKWGTNKNTGLEQFVKNILDKLKIKYIENDRSILEGKELDIYCPEYSIAIECNGCFWHSRKSKDYHINKFKKCESKGIRLITIWDDWIVNCPDVLENVIRGLFSIYDNALNINDCHVRKIDGSEANNFIMDYDVYGQTRANHYYGLFDGCNELVAVLGLNQISSFDRIWSITRFVKNPRIKINGCFGYMISKFIDEFKPLSIRTYTHNDIDQTTHLFSCGFKPIKKYINDYWVVHKTDYIRYFKTAEEKLNDGDHEIEKYVYIYDSGTTKWQLNIL